jgi:hypothetical protein
VANGPPPERTGARATKDREVGCLFSIPIGSKKHDISIPEFFFFLFFSYPTIQRSLIHAPAGDVAWLRLRGSSIAPLIIDLVPQRPGDRAKTAGVLTPQIMASSMAPRSTASCLAPQPMVSSLVPLQRHLGFYRQVAGGLGAIINGIKLCYLGASQDGDKL